MEVETSIPARPYSPDEPSTLVDVFIGVTRNHKRPDTLNYKSGDRWIPISSDEMLQRAQSIAAGLHAIGVNPGDRVALLSESRVEWTLTDAGSIFAGTIDVPIYPTLTPPQVRYILNDSGACVLFLESRKKFDELKEALGECPAVKHVIFFEPDGVTPCDSKKITCLTSGHSPSASFNSSNFARFSRKSTHAPESLRM